MIVKIFEFKVIILLFNLNMFSKQKKVLNIYW